MGSFSKIYTDGYANLSVTRGYYRSPCHNNNQRYYYHLFTLAKTNRKYTMNLTVKTNHDSEEFGARIGGTCTKSYSSGTSTVQC